MSNGYDADPTSIDLSEPSLPTHAIDSKGPSSPNTCSVLKKAIQLVCKSLTEQSDYLTKLDSEVGDGDLGTNMSTASAAILSNLKDWSNEYPATVLAQLALQLDGSLGGTSGPLYSVFFLTMSNHLSTELNHSSTASEPNRTGLTFKLWVEAALAGATAISDIGGAEEGDRTMLDALLPALRSFQSILKDSSSEESISTSNELGLGNLFSSACIAANEGCLKSAALLPKRGRSTYLQERASRTVDPGCAAIQIIFEALESSS